MRSENEMMNIIIDTAKSDDRILAAYLKGSRTNPNVPKDIYRDFDVMYVVTEVESFRKDTGWMNGFGNIALKQEQDDAFGYGERFGIQSGYENSYSWLLLFEDGNRIDIGVETLSVMEKGTNRNKLFLPLLDKTGCLPKLPPPTDEDFHIKRPSEKRFRGCCNEFYWSLCDVAKGIARDELPFAMATYHTLVRNMLDVMLDWYIGIHTDFSVSSGKLHKYFKKYLPADFYEIYVQTYTDGSYEHFWCAIDAACRLFRKAALFVADYFNFVYPENDESASRNYLWNLRGNLFPKQIDKNTSCQNTDDTGCSGR